MLSLAIVSASCSVKRLDRKVGPTISTVDGKAAYLKVHLADGHLYVLHDWVADDSAQKVTGTGELYDANRILRGDGVHIVAMKDVALYETNTMVTSPGVAALAVITGLSLVGTALCLTNPKSCFGSCPTFYARSDGGRSVLQAEGFSDAIAPSLETNDIDALWETTGRGGPLTLTMTNEAYETHVVKQVDLLAVKRPRGGRVLATPDTLWLASSLAAPSECRAAEGSCLDVLGATDGKERRTLADGEDLAARETIELAFPPTSGRLGLAISTRQSLITTFLLYQGLAYLGSQVTTWLAKLASLDDASREGGRMLRKLVGGIEVQVLDGSEWRTVGDIYETGPIATDVHLIVLPEGARGDRIRLVLQRGGWRMDGVALATLTGEATPLRLAPTKIRGTLGREYAAERTPATALPIVTQPGDSYELHYTLPGGKDDEYELFLDSRGYYLEWMRREWIREENPFAAVRMIATPEKMLRELAPAYKRIEPDIERIFWESRYAHP